MVDAGLWLDALPRLAVRRLLRLLRHAADRRVAARHAAIVVRRWRLLAAQVVVDTRVRWRPGRVRRCLVAAVVRRLR